MTRACLPLGLVAVCRGVGDPPAARERRDEVGVEQRKHCTRTAERGQHSTRRADASALSAFGAPHRAAHAAGALRRRCLIPT